MAKAADPSVLNNDSADIVRKWLKHTNDDLHRVVRKGQFTLRVAVQECALHILDLLALVEKTSRERIEVKQRENECY